MKTNNNISTKTKNLYLQLLNSIKNDFENEFDLKIIKLEPNLTKYPILEELVDSIYNYIGENADLK